jgi:segregation and condensation protein A
VEIKIQQFTGPLDLLLQLIEEQSLDITQVAIARVTEQFLHHVKNLAHVDPTTLADYLSMAAKLLVIKSKAILPTLELDAEEEEVTVDLESRLLLYRKFKEAAKYLKSLDARQLQGFEREVSFGEKTAFFPDPEVTISTLHTTILSVLKSLDEIVSLPKRTIREAISIQEKITNLQNLIGSQIETKLSTLLLDAKDKTEVIVTFLALLELIKQRILVVDQDMLFGDVMIKKYQV